jgi:5-methylcytosine-specific restriction enzyme subunit McrC
VIASPDQVIELTERERLEVPAEDLAYEVGEQLWRRFGDQIAVEFPSPKTGHQWWLTPLDWVGYVPVDRQVGVSLLPKVPVGNVFRMLEYAYRLKYVFPEGLGTADSLPEFFERLANVLAKRVLDRARKGLYRTYVPRRDVLPYMRGELDLRDRLRRPWRVHLACRYQEHTADIEENQILTWTLFRIAHSGACTDRVLPTIRRAYRSLQGFSDLVPLGPDRCVDRLYNRLNEDYEPMHALCRFFLEHGGPIHERGERTMLPFLVEMSGLFEMFVYEWLRAHLPAGLRLEEQKRVPLGRGDVMTFIIDMVLKDAATGETFCVLDTKYKQPDSPAPADVYQITTYALAENCRQAFLVYPAPLKKPIDDWIQDVRVRTVTFGLEGDLEEAGQGLRKQVLGGHI